MFRYRSTVDFSVGLFVRLLMQLTIASFVLGVMLFGAGAIGGFSWLTLRCAMAIPPGVFVSVFIVRVARFAWLHDVTE